jgi:PAS domain-containing protein
MVLETMENDETKKSASDPLAQTGSGFYRELLDHLNDGVYFVDRERRIHYWNEGARRLTAPAMRNAAESQSCRGWPFWIT